MHKLAETTQVRGALVLWPMQLLPVTVQRGKADMYRRSWLII